MATIKGNYKFGFSAYKPSKLKISGCELSNSENAINGLFEIGVHTIEGILQFQYDGRYDHDTERFLATFSLALAADGKVALAQKSVRCWPHDPIRERKRAKQASNQQVSAVDP